MKNQGLLIAFSLLVIAAGESIVELIINGGMDLGAIILIYWAVGVIISVCFDRNHHSELHIVFRALKWPAILIRKIKGV